MSSRLFNGTTDKVLMNLGQVPTTLGAFTTFAIINPTAVTRWNNMISLTTAADATIADLTVTNGNALAMEVSGATASTVTGITTGWQFLAISKASGASTPIGHRFVYSTGLWTHTTSATSVTASGTVGRVYLGALATVDFLQGNMLAAGIYGSSLSNTDIEKVAVSLANAKSMGPLALWLLDQDAITTAIPDVTGGGATQNTLTGTTISNAMPTRWLYTAAKRPTTRPSMFAPGNAR